MTFDLPTDGDYHVIAMTPVIDNVIVMHHLLLFGCDSDKQGEISGPTACEMGSVQCNTLFGAWTVGSAGQCLYHEAGIRIGQKGIKRVLMQVHWNNPEMRDDYSDSSGMTLHYTPKLRPNSAANSRSLQRMILKKLKHVLLLLFGIFCACAITCCQGLTP
nr:dopamine beta-hydroxylase-like [Crassostrea gigas]